MRKSHTCGQTDGQSWFRTTSNTVVDIYLSAATRSFETKVRTQHRPYWSGGFLLLWSKHTLCTKPMEPRVTRKLDKVSF